jgi:hypothetical protein
MATNRFKYLVIIALFLAVGLGFHPSAVAGDAKSMGKEELKARLGDPETLILDVRTGSDWTSSDRKIKGALRFVPEKFKTWAGLLPRGKTIVFYCA